MVDAIAPNGVEMNVQIQPALIARVMLISFLGGCRTVPPRATGGGAQVRTVRSQDLPKFDGGKLRMTVVEVSYGPGGWSQPHSHPCAVLGYVLGALRTQVQGGVESVYQAGETIFERPDSVHLVSANASHSKPVRFLAYFTCDHDTPLTVPAPRP